MTFASDQNKAPSALSANAQRMLELRDKVFRIWLERVRESVAEARNVESPILIDTLPVFYDNIAESLSPDYPRTSGVDGTTVAAEHGGERARITAYNQAALIEEYQIFRATIFDVLHRENVLLDFNETHAINSSIDSGIQEAVEAFSLVHSGFRERFAAALTHDLRGPLAATMTALELIMLLDDPVRIKTVAAKALSSTARMAGMVDELLHTMKFHSGEKIELELARFDICEVVREVQADSALGWGQRFEVDARTVTGYWDRAALKRALENLVSNAVKYGSEGTPVTIKVDEVYGRLLLSVHNEGAPIPPDQQECIFQMYRRAESAISSDRQGWGIGLPYVRAVAESHGGSIGLDTSQERGTTFVIDIPMDGSLYPNAPTLSQPASR
ncbi:sensor histidine kinase KdpD [Herbaspirillum sp. SJZ107]|uniref:sensor histidine kinase n=1 Tax=Herbaspirillum sp. SJZ107 TaxID=2572881 RepID=UPI00116AFB2C|nr:HAMP domain-containing sensor histidine kinase [Herbaspirillum sp. SJZ107]TQK03113.1 phospho-acceptor domain-containing protein [Herbaspirillum sp. SJZ107]